VKKSPRFYFSFRSPYSWIAARILERENARELYEIEYIPAWQSGAEILALLKSKNGDDLYTPMSKVKRLYILEDIKRLTSKLGYKMSWPIDRDPCWDLPNLAYIAARNYGKEHSFFWAIYQARWEEGQDVCSIDNIQSLAEKVGLNPEAIVEAINDPVVRQTGVELLYKSYRDRVFGFPFFVNGNGEKFWGTDRLEDFISSIKPSNS
jgi:2-hydroxychromene-2-carboxylate isomerase